MSKDTLTPNTVANESCPEFFGMGGVSFLNFCTGISEPHKRIKEMATALFQLHWFRGSWA